MSKQKSIKSQVTLAKLGAAALLGGAMLAASGCNDLGVGPVMQRSGDVQPEASDARSAGSSVLASVTLHDGSQVEFVDMAGNIVVMAEFDAKSANPLASLSEEATSLVGLYENLAGRPAPRALVDAEQRLASIDRSAGSGMPGSVVEHKSGPEVDPSISMSATAFEDMFCWSSGFCITNRTTTFTATQFLVLTPQGAVDCTSGKVSAVLSDKMLGQGPFIRRWVKDVNAGRTLTFASFYLLPTDARVVVSPFPTGRYHLSFH